MTCQERVENWPTCGFCKRKVSRQAAMGKEGKRAKWFVVTKTCKGKQVESEGGRS